MIAGPSSSGKTTTTKRLGEYLFSKGYDPVVISSDDYFIDRDKLKKNENGEYDLECLAAVDVKYLNNDLHKLTRGELVTLPSYNFINGEKELRNRPIKLKDNSIILIEGIHSLNDDLIPNIEKNEKYKIYLSPFIPLNIDRHNYISSLDLRLLRRMVRDNRSRGYGVSETIHNWRKVRDGEEKNIFPYIKGADAIINTALVYELGVLKTYAEPLLLNVEVDSMYYMEAKRLLNFLKPFFAITSEYIDSSSILREFIGGGDD
jgi:uridine kinase